MATAFNTAAQELVFTALSGNLTGCAVFDTPPFLPEAAPATTFPYCVIGNDTNRAWDTDDSRGAEVTLTLPGGQHVITAVVTDDSVNRLGLAPGQAVTAVFKASSVFLAAID